MKITRENLKNIVREAMIEENEYQEFFKKALEKTGKSIPQMSDEEKKAFFNKIDASWKGKGEKNERFGRGVEGPTFGSANEEDLDEEAVVVSKRTPEGNIVSKLKEESESVNEGKFKVDDLVYNKRTKTVGIVRMGDDKYGEVKTDADGNVDVDELEKYNPIKFKHQTKAKVAPSTEKEVSKRGLFNPFKNESTNERMGSDKGAVGNANFNNRLKAMRDAKNSFVAFIDTNKGKKLLKVFKTQQTAKQFTKKNMDKLLNTKGVESVGTMPKKEWDAKEAKYAIK